MPPCNNPLAARSAGDPLAERFELLTERRYLKNVTAATLVWYQVAWKNYQRGNPPARLPCKVGLQQMVIGLRRRGLKPVTINTGWCRFRSNCATGSIASSR